MGDPTGANEVLGNDKDLRVSRDEGITYMESFELSQQLWRSEPLPDGMMRP